MAKTKTPAGLAEWAVRLLLWLYVLISIPLYVWFLHHVSSRWSEALPAEDTLRLWLPIIVPGAAATFTLISSMSWWWSTGTRTLLLGRTRCWVLLVLVGALSLAAGVAGSTTRDLEAAVLSVMATAFGITGLWLLPPLLSPNLLGTLSPKKTSAADPA
ncbi:hypothetical protein ACFVUW_10980 [Streptomyces xiamenensis]|uniref:hypothetical protein n=1 Tax=Streptomyces xiamenensis TaxID=408015 RepID=UPI0036EDA0DE